MIYFRSQTVIEKQDHDLQNSVFLQTNEKVFMVFKLVSKFFCAVNSAFYKK